MPEAIDQAALDTDLENAAAQIASRLHMVSGTAGAVDSYFLLREACASDVWRQALDLFLQHRSDG